MPRYAPPPGSTDEAVAPDGAVRPHYAALLGALEGRDLAALREELAAAGARDGTLHGDHVLHVDPVPRLLDPGEWARLAAGLEQRLRALEAFVADAHGPRRTVAAGVVPADVLDSCIHLEPEVAELPPPARWIPVAGPDVIRHPDGELVVLEDNVRTPTLMAHAAWARRPVAGPLLGSGVPEPRPFGGPLVAALRAELAAAAPGVAEPHVVVLDDGPGDLLGWEAAWLARELGTVRVDLGGLRSRGDRLVLREGGRPVDVLYRRTSEERLRGEDGRPNELGAALLPALRAGTLAVVNPFGPGVADDKRTYPYVERLVRFLLGEEPRVRSLPTLDLGVAADRAQALERLDELVIKPRAGSGGHGLLLGPRASRSEREEIAAAIAADPGAWVAQELLTFSTHPTVVDGALAPRHVDLRAFLVGGRALPGGLSRVALAAGDLVVNCSQGGGGKDTWVLGG